MAEAGHTFESENPIVRSILAGTAPAALKAAAARGALPITAEEQFHVLYALAREGDRALLEALQGTLDGLADDALSALLSKPTLAADILDFFARRTASKPQSLAAIARHRAVSNETLALLAVAATTELAELLVTNQTALIRNPSIIDVLLANPNTSPDQRRRLLEVREEFFLKKEREEKRRKDEEERLAKLREKKEWTASELENLANDLAKEAAADHAAGILSSDADEAVAESEEAAFQSATQRILSMSVPEKVLLAIRGNRTERNLLIRDSNRLVASSVIKSPKINDNEVEYYAGLRNVNDEILRYIGHRREWVKNYSVILTLAKNPRTPLATSINLLNRLQQRDLKILEGDKGVPETLRRQAKQILDKMNKKSGQH